MTFGDAATRLIVIGLMHEHNLYDDMKERPEAQQQEALHKAVLSTTDGTAQP